MNNNNKKVSSKELAFKDILHILKQYKWSIIILTLLSALLSYGYLYFKPSLYSSYAILKVKPSVKAKSEDVIINTTAAVSSKDVKEEISLLKTFKINNHALDKIHMKVQYYIDKKYKKVEIFKKIPIKIKNINILNNQVIGKKLTLIPKENGYSIQYNHSYKEKIQHAVFKTKLFSFDGATIFPYNKPITSKYFNITIDKKLPIDQPIHFVIHGDKRQLFENIVKPRLQITQLEKKDELSGCLEI